MLSNSFVVHHLHGFFSPVIFILSAVIVYFSNLCNWFLWLCVWNLHFVCNYVWCLYPFKVQACYPGLIFQLFVLYDQGRPLHQKNLIGGLIILMEESGDILPQMLFVFVLFLNGCLLVFQPVLHNWCNKGRCMYYPVCGMIHIKEHLLLIGKSSTCGGSGFHV